MPARPTGAGVVGGCGMPRAYSMDLRERVLAAAREGG
jgi:hypothetical protein